MKNMIGCVISYFQLESLYSSYNYSPRNFTMSVNNIIRTIQFIEENYHREISIQEIERVSCYSYRNIQRIFKHTCNETIGEFKKRLKLENAYKLLLFNNEDIKNISNMVGFETPSSFAKAFKQHFNITPSEARDSKELIFEKNNIMISSQPVDIPFETVKINSKDVYYSRVIAPYDSDEIEQLWKKFTKLLFPTDNTQYYGVIADETLITDDIKSRYDACSDKPAFNTSLPVKKIFGGKFVKFTHTGNYQTIEQTYKTIYSHWMLNSELEFSNNATIEHYNYVDEHNADNNITDIYIPLK